MSVDYDEYVTDDGDFNLQVGTEVPSARSIELQPDGTWLEREYTRVEEQEAA